MFDACKWEDVRITGIVGNYLKLKYIRNNNATGMRRKSCVLAICPGGCYNMVHAKHRGVNAMRAPYEILGTSENPGVGEVRTAYRALAKRWHPDRFAAGPERAWAGDRMAEINAAYRALLNSARAKDQNEAEKLRRVRQMIDDGRLTGARELLMGMPTRCAEWNYLFGNLLMKLNDYNKALIYLSVAAHQKPDSAKYASAELAARAAVEKKRRLFR